MKKLTFIITAGFLCTLLVSCASTDRYKKGEADAKKAINCSTAEADIRVLQSEKAHASQQLAAGVTAIVPVGLVVGVATHTEGTKASVASGHYNKMLDDKIAEIRAKCGVQ